MARFRQSLPAISALYFQRSATWLKAFFFLVSGISIGVFTELSLPEEEKVRAGSYLMEHLFYDNVTIDHGAVFFQSAENHLGLLLLMFLSGLTSFGVPAAWTALAYQGVALGFSAALFMESMAFRGALTMGLVVLPPHLLVLPALMLAAVSVVNSLRDRKLHNRRKKSLSFEAGPYCFSFLLPLLLILLSALLEAFISPASLQLIK